MEQLQSHIWLTASSYMGKYFRISTYFRKPFLTYDFATAPLWISVICSCQCFLSLKNCWKSAPFCQTLIADLFVNLYFLFGVTVLGIVLIIGGNKWAGGRGGGELARANFLVSAQKVFIANRYLCRSAYRCQDWFKCARPLCAKPRRLCRWIITQLLLEVWRPFLFVPWSWIFVTTV